uniref:Phytanoyl-CoA dioxygenase n=1 Tax=Pyrodinium bahamense TaxID=73915 RepID=A0A7S0A9V3_9DINO
MPSQQSAPPAHSSCAAAIADANAILLDRAVPTLTPAELQSYCDQGFLVVRNVLPTSLANVIREHIIHPGFKHRGLDPEDPTTWGKGGLAVEQLNWQEWLTSLFVSESPYSGQWCRFEAGLEKDHRKDLGAGELKVLHEAWRLANEVVALRFRAVLDQLVGPGEWDEAPLRDKGVLPKCLHVRYGLPSKDPRRSLASHRWPRVGWHIDGAWNDHQLGQRRGQEAGRPRRADHCCVGLILYSEVLPKGGLTGVVPGSHDYMMRKVLAHTRSGGIPNARVLAGQTLSPGAPLDPAAQMDHPLQPGDALLMHPYLVHSSAWNFQPSLRIATRISFNYKVPHNAESLLDMGRRQLLGAESSGKSKLPPNTELFLRVLEEEPWQMDDWNAAPSPKRVRIGKALGLTRG